MFLRRRSVAASVVFSFLLAVIPAAGQEMEKPDPASLPSTATLPASYPVITLKEACGAGQTGASHSGKDCSITVTRIEFERLVHALNPKMSKGDQRRLAENYARMLALSHEAARKGLDKNPDVQALLRYTRANALASATFKDVLHESAESSSEAVEKYYEKNKDSFDRYTVNRIFIPRRKQGQADEPVQDVSDENGGSSQAAMKTLADEIQAAAASGADFGDLQKKVFEAAGIKGEPKVVMQEVGRGDLPEGHNQIFDMPLGRVSAVMADAGGYYIYKVVARRTPSFDSIRDEVNLHMQDSNTRRALQKIEGLSKAKVNQAYFDKYDPPPPDENEPDMDSD